MKLRAWMLAALALSVGTAFGHGDEFGRELKVIVKLQPKDYIGALHWLHDNDYDVAGVNTAAGTIDVVLSESPAPAHPLARAFRIVKSETVRAPDKNYFNPEKVEAALKDFENRYPDLAHVESIGKSNEGRDIWAIRITSNARRGIPEGTKKAVLFDGMHHARELMAAEVPMDIIEFLLTNYNKDAKVTQWVDGVEIWVVPMLNVDGNAKVWAKDSMWRKNTRDGFGVDINRNYPYNWNGCGGSSGLTISESYRGKAAGSEPETQALVGLAKKIQAAFNLSFHSYSELVLYPYGCQGQRPDPKVVAIGQKMASLLPGDSGGSYTPGSPWDILYDVDGDSITYMAAVVKAASWVVEIGTEFQPPYSKRDPTVKKLRAAWQLVLDEALK